MQRCAALQAHPSRRRSLRQGEPAGNAPSATAAAMSTGVVISAAGFSASNILRPPARDRLGRPGRGPGQHTYLESVTSESASESAKSMTDSREPWFIVDYYLDRLVSTGRITRQIVILSLFVNASAVFCKYYVA